MRVEMREEETTGGDRKGENETRRHKTRPQPNAINTNTHASLHPRSSRQEARE